MTPMEGLLLVGLGKSEMWRREEEGGCDSDTFHGTESVTHESDKLRKYTIYSQTAFKGIFMGISPNCQKACCNLRLISFSKDLKIDLRRFSKKLESGVAIPSNESIQ